MNISQHLFVPFGKVLPASYYNTSSSITSYPDTFCTELSSGLSCNSYQLFPCVAPPNYSVLRGFNSSEQGVVTRVGTGSVSRSLLRTKQSFTCTSLSFTGSTNYYPVGTRIYVLSLAWFEIPTSSSVNFSSINSLVI